MNRIAVARELVKLARELVSIEFPTQDAMDKYLKEHPGADRSNHRVVKKRTPEGDKKIQDTVNRLYDDQESGKITMDEFKSKVRSLYK